MSGKIRRETVGKLHVPATAKVLKPMARGFTLTLALKLRAMGVWAASGEKVQLTPKDVAVLVWRNNSEVWRNNSRSVVAARGIVVDELQLSKQLSISQRDARISSQACLKLKAVEG